jgi:hypothetical protein
MEDPPQVFDRTRKSEWPPEREGPPLDGVETPSRDEEWIWARICTEEERERVKHLLEKCKGMVKGE